MVLMQTNIFGESKDICISHKTSPKVKRDDNSLSEKYRQLHKIYERIYDTLDINLFEQREIIIKGNLIAYPDERQAELMGTQLLSLDERIRRHKEWILNLTKETIEKTITVTKI